MTKPDEVNNELPEKNDIKTNSKQNLEKYPEKNLVKVEENLKKDNEFDKNKNYSISKPKTVKRQRKNSVYIPEVTTSSKIPKNTNKTKNLPLESDKQNTKQEKYDETLYNTKPIDQNIANLESNFIGKVTNLSTIEEETSKIGQKNFDFNTNENIEKEKILNTKNLILNYRKSLEIEEKQKSIETNKNSIQSFEDLIKSDDNPIKNYINNQDFLQNSTKKFISDKKMQKYKNNKKNYENTIKNKFFIKNLPENPEILEKIKISIPDSDRSIGKSEASIEKSEIIKEYETIIQKSENSSRHSLNSDTKPKKDKIDFKATTSKELFTNDTQEIVFEQDAIIESSDINKNLIKEPKIRKKKLSINILPPGEEKPVTPNKKNEKNDKNQEIVPFSSSKKAKKTKKIRKTRKSFKQNSKNSSFQEKECQNIEFQTSKNSSPTAVEKFVKNYSFSMLNKFNFLMLGITEDIKTITNELKTEDLSKLFSQNSPNRLATKKKNINEQTKIELGLLLKSVGENNNQNNINISFVAQKVRKSLLDDGLKEDILKFLEKKKDFKRQSLIQKDLLEFINKRMQKKGSEWSSDSSNFTENTSESESFYNSETNKSIDKNLLNTEKTKSNKDLIRPNSLNRSASLQKSIESLSKLSSNPSNSQNLENISNSKACSSFCFEDSNSFDSKDIENQLLSMN